MKIRIANEDDLQRWVADKLAPALLRAPKPVCVALTGTLGAGKTATARSLIRHLYGDENLEVPSPTYTLLQTYSSQWGEIYHYDLYRLHHPDEVIELGWDERAQAFLTLVEWPERLGYLTPKDVITLAIDTVSGCDTARTISITGLDIAA